MEPKINQENPTLWDELKPVDNFPDYRLSDVANPTRCHRCRSAVWHLIDRAGFEVKLDPEALDAQSAADLGANGKTYFFPTIKFGTTFMTGFLKSTDRDIEKTDFDKTVHLAWHRCNLDNIRTDIINHWSYKR